jgi:hypothetical protein
MEENCRTGWNSHRVVAPREEEEITYDWKVIIEQCNPPGWRTCIRQCCGYRLVPYLKLMCVNLMGIRWTFSLGLGWTPRRSIPLFFSASWTRFPRPLLPAIVVKIPCIGTSDVCDECRCSWLATVAKPSPLLYDRCPFILTTEFVKELHAHSSLVTFFFH